MAFRSTLTLGALALILAYAVSRYGGVVPADWNVCLLALGILAVLYWLRTPRADLAPPLLRSLRWLLALWPAYVAFQLLPLPERLLRLLSPARAELLAAVTSVLPGAAFAPLSVVPAVTLAHFFWIAGFTVVFLLVRELTWYWSSRPWIPALPIIALGVAESALGLAQYAMGGRGSFAQGTYVNKNHFAGFLEMALPFAVMRSVAAWRGVDTRHRFTLRRGAVGIMSMAASALMFLGIIYSLSRAGFVASLGSLFLMGALAVSAGLRAWTKRLALACLAILVALGLVFLPPDQWLARSTELFSSHNITANERLALWRETTRLIAAYPVFGCGLGGYESAFLKYKVSGPLLRDDYAHNDYLQLLAELGAAGFLIAAALLVTIWREAFRAATRRGDSERRHLALACTGAIVAILIHSLADFNLYIPANAMLLTWASGLCAGLAFGSPRPNLWKTLHVPQVLDARAQP